MVDTSLERDTLAISAHVSRPVMLKGKHVATEFVEVDCQIQMEEAEKIGCEFQPVEILYAFIKCLANAPTLQETNIQIYNQGFRKDALSEES